MRVFNCTGCGDSGNAAMPPSTLLSAPCLNSTSRLYHKLNTFKQHKPPTSTYTPHSSTSADVSHQHQDGSLSRDGDAKKKMANGYSKKKHASSKQASSSSCSVTSGANDLDEMTSSKPLQVCVHVHVCV